MKKTLRSIAIIGMLLPVGSSFAETAETRSDADQVAVMTFNILRGGTALGQPLSQTAKLIQMAKADIVGLQEGGKNVEKLAELLGWNHSPHGGTAILTRYDIVENYKTGIRVRLDSGREANVFNLHLRPAPYQPYQLLGIPYGNAPFIKTESEAIASANKARGQQIDALFEQLKELPDQSIPIFVTGDFNEPSHLDWTEAAAEARRHPIKVAFPTSLAMAKAGFVDTWRATYPDEMKKPGFTWTPLTKANDPRDHHDRIDFVYFRGNGVKMGDVKIVGEDKENADIVVSPYPSDHRAVVASFTVSE